MISGRLINMNWVFVTNFDFLTPISLQSVCVNLWYFKISLFQLLHPFKSYDCNSKNNLILLFLKKQDCWKHETFTNMFRRSANQFFRFKKWLEKNHNIFFFMSNKTIVYLKFSLNFINQKLNKTILFFFL